MAGRGDRRQHRDSLPAATPARLLARGGRRRSWSCASSTSIPASRRRSPPASASGRSATCARDTSGWRSCIQASRSSLPGAPLPDRLTPVYPTTAGLAQENLRKLVHRALARDPAYLAETLPPWTREPRRLWGFAQAVRYLHEPSPDASQAALDERTHPAWTRLKFDELLAQQLSLKMHRRARARRRAPPPCRRRLAHPALYMRGFRSN